MKKMSLFFAVVLIMVTGGCQLISGPINLGAPTFPAQLCAEYDASTSNLLKISTERGIPLNELYYGFLDVAQIGLVVEALDKEKVKTFMVNLGAWYDKNYPMNSTTLIQYMVDQEKAQALSGILSRRIGYFKSDLIIGSYDDCMYRAGWNNAMDELFLR
jgi:hypothetical protein